MPIRGTDGRTLLETALRHERIVVATLMVATPLLCWAWIAPMARDMYGTMEGASAWVMTADWDAAHLLLLFAMWAAMMTAMMLPSASPLVLLYAGALRAKADATVAGKTYALAAGYLLVWLLFSAAATVLQRVLASLSILTSMMEPATPLATALLLAVAGIYQLSPAKRACLRVCRSPLSFLLQRWPDRALAAFSLGIRHGAYCVGCCWALMLLLFAGGVMNLAVIVGLTLWVLIEKWLPFGDRAARVSGVLLLALAAWSALA
jgi:predicted metal-binding membrane protein